MRKGEGNKRKEDGKKGKEGEEEERKGKGMRVKKGEGNKRKEEGRSGKEKIGKEREGKERKWDWREGEGRGRQNRREVRGSKILHLLPNCQSFSLCSPVLSAVLFCSVLFYLSATSQLRVVDFTVTIEAIENQLITEIIRCERPDLEERREALSAIISDNRSQLSGIENQMLSLLASYSGDILGDNSYFDRFACHCCFSMTMII